MAAPYYPGLSSKVILSEAVPDHPAKATACSLTSRLIYIPTLLHRLHGTSDSSEYLVYLFVLLLSDFPLDQNFLRAENFTCLTYHDSLVIPDKEQTFAINICYQTQKKEKISLKFLSVEA